MGLSLGLPQLGLDTQQNILAQILGSATLFAPLTHSLTLNNGTGVGTLVRATTQTVQNNDGYLVTALAGEAAWKGARRVDNLIRLGATQSSTLAIAAAVTMTLPAGAYQFSMGAGTGTVTFSGTGGATGTLAATVAGRVSVAKTITAGTLVVTGSVAILNDIQVVSLVADTDQTTIREYVSVGVGTGSEVLADPGLDNTASWTKGAGATVSGGVSTWASVGNIDGIYSLGSQTIIVGRTYVVTYTVDSITAGGVRAYVGGVAQSGAAATAGTYTVSIVATATTAPSFLANGTTSCVISAVSVKMADHGSGVDGVKWFNTDISGNPIPAATLDGIEIWPAATNLALQSQTFDNASWTKPAGVTITPNATVAPDGTTTADTYTADAAGNQLDQGVAVSTGTVYTNSLYFLKTVGATYTPALYLLFSGGTTKYSTVRLNTDTGVVTVVALGGWTAPDAYSVEDVGDYWRVSVTGNSGNNTTGHVRTYTNFSALGVVGAGSQVIWGAQLELGSYASPYIPTTTGAVTRNATVDSHPTSGNITAAAGTILLTYTPGHAASGTVYLWGSYVDANNGTYILHDATNLILRKRIAGVNTDATIANAFVSGTSYKMAATWGAGGQTIALNGTLGTPHANTASAQIAATMQLGADGNGAGQPGFALEAEYIMQRQLSNSELQAVTL